MTLLKDDPVTIAPAPGGGGGYDMPPARLGGDGAGGQGNPPPADDTPPANPEALFHTRRNSIFPLLVDVGAVAFMFGLIIVSNLVGPLTGQLVMGLGALTFVIGLVGWVREARADYRRLAE